MSYTDEYLALKKKKKEKVVEQLKTGHSFTDDYIAKRVMSEDENDVAPVTVSKPVFVNKTANFFNPDIAPVTRATTAKKKDEDRKWFDTDVFDDGVTLKNIGKAILGTGTDIAENLGAGILGMGEKALDAIAYVSPLIAQGQFYQNGGAYQPLEVQKGFNDSIDQSKTEMDKFIQKDLYDEEKVAKKIVLGTDKNSVLGEKTDALVQSGGQLLATAGLQAVGVPWFLTTGATSFGGQAETALKEGAGYEEAGLSAAVSAGAEILTEKLSGGIKFGGKTLDDVLLKPLTDKIANKTAKVLVNLGVDALGEGTEEVVSGVFSNLGTALYKEEGLDELLFSEEAMDEYLESFIGGAVLGGVSSGVGAIRDSKRIELTENEQKVVDFEVEKRIADQDLTDKEKNKIRNDVVRDMMNGYISTDTIEEVLGGETYKTHTDTIAREKAMQEEYDTLYQMKNGDKSDAQIDRQAELKKQLDEIKQNFNRDQLGSEVMSLVKNDRLSESYNERSRSGQAFQADVSKYDTKQRETIQKAIDSGILNNTNRTHEFVDMIAKITADKGVLFDFTNNEKLKESGFAVDGKSVNGFVNGNTVTLNVDSAKARNSVVGHEITHVLEGTELYTELQKVVAEYAKTKGEYDSRLASITELYKNIEGADINAELTADLVGDYLFSDTDFVNHLSVTNRNMFQKMYDEIKYLYKVATAGSKEARELEKVKKVFEKAYKAGGKTQADAKYSLTIKHTDGTVEELADARGLTNEQAINYLEQAKAGTLRRETYVPVRKDTPQVIIDTLAAAGENVENLSMVMQVRKAQQAMAAENHGNRTGKHGSNVRKHALTPEEVVEIVNNLDDPSMIILQTNRQGKNGDELPNNVAVFVEYSKNGKEGVAVIEFESSINPEFIGREYGDTSYHTVVTVFEPDAERNGMPFDYAEELLSNPDNIELEIEKRQSTGSATGEKHPNTSSELPSFEDIVPQNGGSVKHSLSDSDGRELSKEQQEYFRDSKIRDSNGSLMVMYHGTQKGGFTVFQNKRRPNTEGFYFTNDKKYSYTFEGRKANGQLYPSTKEGIEAGYYNPQRYKVYLDVKKPLVLTADQQDIIEDIGYWEHIYKPVKEAGYDGVMMEDMSQVFVFSPEQIKNVDNLNPTSDPDIRRSLSDINEQPAPVGSLQELKLKTAPAEAPVQETVAENATVEENLFPDDDYAPMFKDEPKQQTEEERKQTRKQLHQSIVDNVKATFKAKGFDFDKVLKNAENLSTFSTVDNMPQRVMEKALGYKEGQMLSDLTVNKVAQNETEGIKWLNGQIETIKKISKQHGIKPGSKASAAAQMYAEGFYVAENNDIIAYGDAELAKDFPDIKVQQNIKALANDPRIRHIYDDTLAMINASRTRNAYPEIPRLDNYFLHFRAMDDTFSKLGLPFNPNDIRAKDLPTDLNGVTADLKPGQPYFASAMHRTGKRTSFDLLGGLERYLNSAKNQIYHIDDIQTLRALRNYIADTYGQANGLEGLDVLSEEEAQERIEKVYNSHLSTFAKFLNEEANVLAGKTALIDRGLEGIIGRRGITFLNTVNGQVGSNMVGFNISSSLTNFLPVAQTIAKTNKFDFVKAFSQTVANKLSGGRFDTFAEDSPVIIRRKGSDRFYRTPWQKLGDVGYVFMSAVDDISTEMIARTKYNELTRKGMDTQKAHYETDKWVSRLMGDRSLGQMPQLYNSKMLGLVTKFQLEVRNQLDSQFYDTIQDAKVSTEHIENRLARNAKMAAKVTSTLTQLALAQHLFGKAFESVAGYNPAFDIISVLMTAFGYDDDEDSEDTVLDNVEQAFLELLEDLPYTSTFTDGGRIPISSALPIGELIKGVDEWGNEKSRWKTLGEIAPYYLMPGGYGQAKKTKAGLEMFSDDHPIAGSYTDSGNLRFPVEDTLKNRVQAGIFGQWSSENARDYFDNERKPLAEKKIQEFKALDISIQDYWAYQDEAKKISDRAESEGASDKDILKSKYLNSVNDELAELIKEKQKIMDDQSLSSNTKQLRIKPIQQRFDELAKEGYASYNNVKIDGDYANIGDRYFQWYTPEEGEPYWRKLSEAQTTKYLVTSKAGSNAHYATDGNVHYRRDEDGEWTKISDKQLERQNEVTRELGITPEEYWRETEISFMPMSDGEYEYAYDNPENYAVAKAVGGYDAYRGYSKDLYNIKADKDENGKSISGSRKEKVLDYINNLDADYYTKIILWKSEYNSDDSYNEEIIDYLNGRDDISFEETIAILRKLGFDVTDDGDISW